MTGMNSNAGKLQSSICLNPLAINNNRLQKKGPKTKDFWIPLQSLVFSLLFCAGGFHQALGLGREKTLVAAVAFREFHHAEGFAFFDFGFGKNLA